MTYLLDANVFIQAKNLQYGFDFCPAFWDWLDEQAAADQVGSIEKVLDGLKGAVMTSPPGQAIGQACSHSQTRLW
jgi:Domain of unknown function (DUF4411)